MDEPGKPSFLYLFPSSIGTDAQGALSLKWTDPAGAFARRELPSINPSLPTVQWRPNALTSEECRKVIEIGERLPRTDGRVELGPDAYRVSHIAWIEPAPETHWLFHKLAVLFAEANRHYGFELVGFVDALQYTVYGAEQHFDWHLDLGMDQTSARKLSMSLQLTDPRDYAGGELELISVASGAESRQLGSATFFPSYLAHRVKPVTSGMRRSLVAWAYGPAFK
jgi:PKHD-type hydroxylase